MDEKKQTKKAGFKNRVLNGGEISMVIAHTEYTASIRIEYRWSKHSDNMEEYMKRHGWHEAGCGTGFDLGNGNRSYVIFTKKFADVNTMQNEVQDINDAFND